MPKGTKEGAGVEEAPEQTLGLEADQGLESEHSGETESELNTAVKHESAAESAARAYEELEAASTEEEASGGEDKDPPKEKNSIRDPKGRFRKVEAKTEAAKKTTEEPIAGEDEAEDLRPPQRLRAEQKELFNKLPPALRKATHEMFRDHEALFTRRSAQLQESLRESEGVLRTIKPYLKVWGAQGLAPETAIARLAAAHTELLEDFSGGLRKLAAQGGKRILIVGEDDIDEEFSGENTGKAPTSRRSPSRGEADLEGHPLIKKLTSDLSTVQNEIRRRDDAVISERADAIKGEIEAVIDEKDQTGRYRYPRFHDREFFSRAKPLVSALMRATPSLKYADAFRRAYAALDGDSPQRQTGLPAANKKPSARVTPAAVSVRGGSSPSVGLVRPDQIPADAKETARLAYERLEAGEI